MSSGIECCCCGIYAYGAFVLYNITMPTTNQGAEKAHNNPTGIGGFGDNPQNINRNPKLLKNEQRFSYWLPFFKDLPDDVFNNYIKTRGKGKMFMAESIAYERVKNSKGDVTEYKDLADRTEGRAVSRTEISGVDGGAVEVETKLSPAQQDLINEGVKDILLKLNSDAS